MSRQSPPARLALLSLLVALSVTVGCGPPFQTRAMNVTVTRARIASLPAITLAYELDFGNSRTPMEAWADAMASRLTPEVNRWVVGNGGHAFPEQDSTELGDRYLRFRKWTVIALMEIAAQKTGHADFGLHSVDKWRFGSDLSWLKELLVSDFVLVTLFRDMKQTTGRVVGRTLGGMFTSWMQVGSACVVDLKDGRMVWCNAKYDAWGDLSVAATARAAVGELLTDLYYPPKQAQ